ncbi:MAG: MinD/ParA family protein [Promethearchaeota archaeon]
MKTICAHSYKGGTGKTTLCVNIAAEAARRGFNVGLFDIDLRAPSLTTLFNYEPDYYVNDYFKSTSTLDEILSDVAPVYDLQGNLLVAFSSPEIQVISKMVSKGGQLIHINMLKALLSAVKKLQGENRLDLLVWDSSPGIEPWSVNAIIAADITFIVLKPSRLDRLGTQRMLQGIYHQLPEEKLFYLVFNRFVPGSAAEPLQQPTNNNYDVMATIPCYCDHVIASDEEIFVLSRPEHPFSNEIRSLVDRLEDQIPLHKKE